MLKILVSCVNGAGTSMMMFMSVQNAVNSMNVKADIHHCAISEGVTIAPKFDVVFCPACFVNMYKDAAEAGVHILGLRNVLSEKEVREKLAALDLLGKDGSHKSP